MAEVFQHYERRIEESTVLDSLGLIPERYILLSAHREENIDIKSNFQSLMKAVNAMAERYYMPILYFCRPQSRKSIEAEDFILMRGSFSTNLLGSLIIINFKRMLFA